MTSEKKKPVTRRITPVKNNPSSVPRVVKRTTLRDESRDKTDSTVEEQVAALKKIPANRIGKNEYEVKTAEIATRLREVLSENVRLSSVVESARRETKKYRQLNEKAAEEMTRTIEARNESDKKRLKTESTIEELQSEIQALHNELSERTHSEQRKEYLRVHPDQMAEMITDFEQALSNSISGLILSNLELRLKVAVETEGDRIILLLPPISKRKIISDRLNEFVVRVLPSGVIGIP